MVSQQLLQQVSLIPTPLGKTTSYHIANKTRIKSLITMKNSFGRGISYSVYLFLLQIYPREERHRTDGRKNSDRLFSAALNEISVDW